VAPAVVDVEDVLVVADEALLVVYDEVIELLLVKDELEVEVIVILLKDVVVPLEHMPPGTFKIWPRRSLSQLMGWFVPLRSLKETPSLSAIFEP
jgi:hypothetical protein